MDIYKSIDRHSVREDYHDTIQLIQEAVSLFNLGYLNLNDRAMAEWLYGRIIKKINGIVEKLKPIPEELQNFKQIMRQTYFANFSLFQSIPDSWAIDQLFPIMPIQRLTENRISSLPSPTSPATLTRDHQLRWRERPRTKALPLHKIRKDEDYYIGFFLIGAYQEILGDLHNLFRRHQRRAISPLTKRPTTRSRHSHHRATPPADPQICPVRRQRDSQKRAGQPGKQRSCPPQHHRGEQPLPGAAEKSLQSYTYLGE